jgi:hypothetical protein
MEHASLSSVSVTLDIRQPSHSLAPSAIQFLRSTQVLIQVADVIHDDLINPYAAHVHHTDFFSHSFILGTPTIP